MKYDAVNYNAATNPAAFINPAAKPWELVVNSQSGTQKKFDIFIQASTSTDLAIKSGSEFLVSVVNNAGLQLNVHYAITLDQVASALVKADGSPLGALAVRRPGVKDDISEETTRLFIGDKLVVTAQNGTKKEYLIITNAKSADLSLALFAPYNAAATSGTQNFVISVARSVVVPYSTDFAGNVSVQLAQVRRALTGVEYPFSELTRKFQTIGFEQLNTVSGEWSAVETENTNIRTGVAQEPQYRVVVTAQNGTKAYYPIVVEARKTAVNFTYAQYSDVPVVGLTTQKVIMSSNQSSIIVAPKIDNNSDDVTAQDILDTVQIGTFQHKEIQYKLKTTPNWTGALTVSEYEYVVLNFTTTDYRLVIKSQDAATTGYYAIVPAALQTSTNYGLVADQTTLISQANASPIVVTSVDNVTLNDILDSVFAQSYATISFEKFVGGSWTNSGFTDYEYVTVTAGSPDFRMVVTAQNGTTVRQVPIMINAKSQNVKILPVVGQSVFTLSGNVITISDTIDRDELLAAINSSAFAQTVKVYSNTEQELESNGPLFNYYYVSVQAQDSAVPAMIYTIMVQSSNSILPVGAYTKAVSSTVSITATVTISGTVATVTLTGTGSTQAQRDAFAITTADLLTNVFKTAGQSYQFITSENLVKTSANLFADDAIVVTAQDGSTTTYKVVIER